MAGTEYQKGYEQFYREDQARKQGFQFVGRFFEALRSHDSIDKDWLRASQDRMYAILEGR